MTWIWRIAENNKAREAKAEHKLDDIKYNQLRDGAVIEVSDMSQISTRAFRGREDCWPAGIEDPSAQRWHQLMKKSKVVAEKIQCLIGKKVQ